ncbi:MAG: site-specific integrase [Bacteroidales bacterium]|nr:site-specific integrase [Bacteroidales bacterium]
MGSTLSILLYLKHGSPSKDGRLPLMCRLTIDGESTSFSCKRRISPQCWDPGRGEMTGQGEEAALINRELCHLREQLLSYFAAILQEYGSIRPKWLKEYTLGAPDRHEMLLYMFNKHNEDFRKMVGHGKSEKSYQRYVIVYRHLRAFIRQRYQLEDVRVKYVTITLINAFEQYLRASLGLKNNTVWVYMITFKHIVSLARAAGAIRSDPFATYKNRFEQVERGYLTEEELQRFMLQPLENGVARLIRDLFVFSAFTGLSYTDIKGLRWDNIRQLFDGETWVVTRRRKTNTPSNLLLLDIPKRILEQHGRRGEEHIFRIPSNNCCNNYLVEIGRRCGIATRVTFHIARHTFATLSLSKGVPIETLSSILGHTSIRTTQIYAKITNKKISQDMNALAERIRSLKGPQ